MSGSTEDGWVLVAVLVTMLHAVLLWKIPGYTHERMKMKKAGNVSALV